MQPANPALVALGKTLRDLGYDFTTVTPSTHERVLRNERRAARNLRDIFGWNRAFTADALTPNLFELAKEANILEPVGDKFRSRVRVATLGEQLFLHGSFPTHDENSVFFGPDSYRFCNLLDQHLPPCTRLVDVGCGTGVGGLSVAKKAQHITLADVNPRALELAAVNAAIAGVPAEVVHSDVLASIEGPIDAVIANPPYMRDAERRTYRDGGGRLGEGLALRITTEALLRLQPGGILALYTGSAIVNGEDLFRRQVVALCREAGASFEYKELDPDVFGEELDEADYCHVERIAAVALLVRTATYAKHAFIAGLGAGEHGVH